MISSAVVDDARVRVLLRSLGESQVGFPRVLSVASEPTLTRVVLAVPAELCWFEGHFPEKPILPGVVQLHWAVLVCRTLFDWVGSPNEIKRLKFKRIVAPPAEIELTVSRLDASRPGLREARFTFACDGEQNSEGTIVFPERA